MRNKLLLFSAVALCCIALAAGYNRPYRWWPMNDMSEQEYIKAFTTDSGRAPVPGTVAVGAWAVVPPPLEFLMKQGDHPDFEKPADAATSPKSVANGEALFNIYCATCHGPEMGPTPEMRSPLVVMGDDRNWTMPVADIHRINSTPLYTDEYLYAIITHGSASGVMKRMSYHLDPQERWDVVNYVRTVADKYKDKR